MARPAAKQLTERETGSDARLFGRGGAQTAQQARDVLAAGGQDLAYTTVATLVRILLDKGFLKQTNDERPFVYAAARTHEDVSRRLLGDLVERVFGGSREQLIVRLLDEKKLTAKERARLEQILRETGK